MPASHDLDPKSEASDLLEREVAELAALGFDALYERLTEDARGWLTRRRHRASKDEEIYEVRGASGAAYEVELWAILEKEGLLHVFVRLMGESPDCEWVDVGDDLLLYKDSARNG